MSVTWCNSSVLRKNTHVMSSYSAEMLRRDFQKSMKTSLSYGIHLKKGKRFRSAFTTEQVNYLEKEFRQFPYINNVRRKEVANILNIPERAVKIWFQNRRMKEKKDTTNKDPDEKNTEDSNDQLNNVLIKPSTNEASLPLLTVSDDPSANREVNTSIEQNKLQTKETKLHNLFKDVSENDTSQAPKANVSTPEIRNNAVSTTTSGKQSIELLKKYKTDRDHPEDVNMKDSKTEHSSRKAKRHSPPHTPYKIKCESQSPSYPPYVPAKTFPQDPQDLSAKPNLPSSSLKTTFPTQQNGEAKFNSPEVPLYFTQPYIPPGNMIWKPVNVAPIMSAPVPTVAIPTPSLGSYHHSTIKRSCSCDCHMKTHNNPLLFHQNIPSQNLQYVLTPVPFQNHSHKF